MSKVYTRPGLVFDAVFSTIGEPLTYRALLQSHLVLRILSLIRAFLLRMPRTTGGGGYGTYSRQAALCRETEELEHTRSQLDKERLAREAAEAGETSLKTNVAELSSEIQRLQVCGWVGNIFAYNPYYY